MFRGNDLYFKNISPVKIIKCCIKKESLLFFNFNFDSVFVIEGGEYHYERRQ